MSTMKKRNSKSKNRKGYAPRGSKYKSDERDIRECDNTVESGSKSKTNDPQWYTTTPALLRDAASIPYSNAAGTTYNRRFGGTDVVPDSQNQMVPGIMTFQIVPAIGDDGNFNSPLNIATNALYASVRRANSGTANYDAPNMFMYCMSVAQIYSYINFLMRVYGTSQLYTHYNRYLPEAVVRAQGVDFNSVTTNLADFRYGINVLIHKASAFACPANMTYFNRLAFLFSGIYSEGESVKDQLYMYVPYGFLKLNEQASTPGWQLNLVKMPTGTYGATVKDLLDYGTNLITPLLQSEDFNIISGDVLKAFGSNILGLQSLPEVYTVLPTTDLNVLEQMQNCDYFTNLVISNYVSFNVQMLEQPSTNTIKGEVTFHATTTDYGMEFAAARIVTGNHLLTTILTSPTPEDTIERTRLMVTANDTRQDTELTLNLITGSDFCVGVSIWRYNPLVIGSITELPVIPDVAVTSSVTEATAEAWLNDHCLLENFKFHPAVNYYMATSDGKYRYFNSAVDIDNYALLDFNTVANMNEAALLALLNVPDVGKF